MVSFNSGPAKMLSTHNQNGVFDGETSRGTFALTDSHGNKITSVVKGMVLGSEISPKEGQEEPNEEKKVCLWPTENGTNCGKTFIKFEGLKRHLADIHKGVRPYACSLCGLSYGRQDYLQRHIKSHNPNSANLPTASQVLQNVAQMPTKKTIILQKGQGGTLQLVSKGSNCQQVSGSTTNIGGPLFPSPSLTNSVSQVQKQLGSRVCRWIDSDGNICGKEFAKLEGLRRHVNEQHEGVRPFACTACNKNYGRKDYLDRHMKSHESKEKIIRVFKPKRKDIPVEEKMTCLWILEDDIPCGKTFTKSDGLKRHILEAHKGVRPHACKLCGKDYGRYDYLLRHLKSHNKSKVSSVSTQQFLESNDQFVDLVANSLSNPGLRFSAPVTSSTSTPKSKAQEIRTPEIQKTEKKICRWVIYDGTICGQTFSNNYTFNRHVRETHKGIRPFACHLCEKSYGRKDYLVRHMTCHDG